MKSITYLLSLVLVAATVSACGWRLRGSDDGTLLQQTIYLSQSTGEVYSYLKKQLDKKQGAISIAEADINIVLGNERYDRRDSTVNSNLQTTQYKLTPSIPYEIVDKQGKPLTPQTSAEVIRYYTFNQNAINSSAKEEATLKREMVRQVARQILQRASFLGRQ